MRKMLIPLALTVVVIVSATGCTKTGTRCRNLFRRGAPCFGTAKATPAMIGAPMAIGAPVATTAPGPVMQQVIPQAAPQMMVPQIQCCPQVAPACPPCDPCQVPCEQSCSQGYIEGGVIDSGCQNCETGTTYDPGYIVPSSEIPAGNAQTTGTPVDPAPIGGN